MLGPGGGDVDGGLDVTAWLALAAEDGGPRPLRGLRSLEGCQVSGCVRSVWGGRLCRSHEQRWRRSAGRRDLDACCATTAPGFAGSTAAPRAGCAAADCRYARMAGSELCDGHQRRFEDRRRRKGCTLERFLIEFANPGTRVYDSSGLREPMKVELQFGLQCRSDERTTRMRSGVFADVVDALVDHGYRSLLDAVPYIYERLRPGSRPFVAFVREQRDRLPSGHAGRDEWDRDDRLEPARPAALRANVIPARAPDPQASAADDARRLSHEP